MPDNRAEQADEYADRRVKSWQGQTGIVIAVDLNPAQKPLIVRHDDGSIGYYHFEQVDVAARPS